MSFKSAGMIVVGSFNVSGRSGMANWSGLRVSIEDVEEAHPVETTLRGQRGPKI